MRSKERRKRTEVWLRSREGREYARSLQADWERDREFVVAPEDMVVTHVDLVANGVVLHYGRPDRKEGSEA